MSTDCVWTSFDLAAKLIGFKAVVGDNYDSLSGQQNIMSLALIIDSSNCEEAEYGTLYDMKTFLGQDDGPACRDTDTGV